MRDQLTRRAERAPRQDPAAVLSRARWQASRARPPRRTRNAIALTTAAAVVAIAAFVVVQDDNGPDSVTTGPADESPQKGTDTTDPSEVTSTMPPPVGQLPAPVLTRQGSTLVVVQPDGTSAPFGPELATTDRPELAAGDGVGFATVSAQPCGHDVVSVTETAAEVIVEGATSPAVSPDSARLATIRQPDCDSTGIVEPGIIEVRDLATGQMTHHDPNSDGDGLPLHPHALAWTANDRLVVIFTMEETPGLALAGMYQVTDGELVYERQIYAENQEWIAVAGTGDDLVLAARAEGGEVTVVAVTFADTQGEPVLQQPLAQLGEVTVTGIARDRESDTPVVAVSGPEGDELLVVSNGTASSTGFAGSGVAFVSPA